MPGCHVILLTFLMTSTASVLAQTAPSGWDTSYCQQSVNNPGNSLPNLPDSFSVRAEANFLDKNRTTTLNEFFNQDANIAAVHQVEDGMEGYFFYLYNSNQFLSVIPDGHGGYLCFSQDLSKNDNQFLFGLQKINSSSDRVYSVAGALHFSGNGINEAYLGQEMVRGIPCNKWLSCQYWASMNATSNVTWYFSDDTQWSSVSDYTTPVRCHVTGVRWVNSTYSYNYDHIYEFYDFQADLSADNTVFEVPRNVYCIQETNTKPIPSMPPAYTFSAEVVDLLANTISFIKEEYDNSSNLMRYSYRDPPSSNTAFGTRLVSEIHDFNTGVAYVIDVLRYTCTVTLINNHEIDDVDVGAGKVRLRNPNELMRLDPSYVYQGVRTVRGIECDSWARERGDYPVANMPNPQTTWTWYFATIQWMKTMGYRNNLVLPVMLEIFTDDPTGPMHQQMSFYAYDTDEPDLMTFDLSSCYGNQHSRNYAFLVAGRWRDIIGIDVKQFKYMILISLTTHMNISPLRVTHLDLQESGENILVTFDLLDKAPLSGDVKNPPQELTLEEAYKVLNDSVYTNHLQIILTEPGQDAVRILQVKPAGPQYQFQSPQPSRKRRAAAPNVPTTSSGYTAGVMGGTGFAMLVLGGLLGFGIMFLVFGLKKRDILGAISLQKFENEATAGDANE